MAISARHPQITAERSAEWLVMRDTASGQTMIKARGETYLPKPSGFNSQADGGTAAYRAYLRRSDFPEIVAPTIAALVGIVHSREAQIEMPEAMQGLWENADGHGGSLEAFHRRATRNLLWLGRYGIMADAPEAGGEPFLVGYAGDAIVNWDRDFFALDETYDARAGFVWERRTRYRVLDIEDGRLVVRIYEGFGEAFDLVGEAFPVARGGGALDFVPFVVANARDISPDVEAPPLIGVANAALSIYQLSADYRHQLYMSGQETLVAINGPAPKYVGAGVVHEMRAEMGVAPDLRYVSPTCRGIEAHLQAMHSQEQAAVAAGARMFDTAQRGQESGEARRLRFASETANLMSVATVSAGLLERGLRNVARMMGLDPAAVVVSPPADLLAARMAPQEAEALVRAWQAGAISYRTLYENLQRGGIASAERDDAAEAGLISGEAAGGDDLL